MSGMYWELLDRFLADECTAEEREEVERWMEQAPGHRRRITLLASASASAPAHPKTEVWTAIETELRPQLKTLSLQSGRQQSLSRVAALLLLLGAAALAVNALRSSGPGLELSGPATRVAVTPPGQRASFSLADGTRVMLGVASTLRHPVAFGPAAREVHLQGEAYFDVVYDNERPFLVRAGGLVAEDLGTQFVVRAYAEDGHGRVVVRKGRVMLRAASLDSTASQVLLPGQLGRLESSGRPVVEQVDTSAYFAWTEGRLVFIDVPLQQALPQLGRWYDLDFHLADSGLGSIALTATLKNQPTADALHLLATALGLRQERNGRTVTFSSGTDQR